MPLGSGEGYCIRCRRGVPLKDRVFARYKNNMPVERGTCTNCGAKVTRMLNKQELEQYLMEKEIEEQL